MPDLTPWAQFGLAGLFAVFALTLLAIFMRHVENVNAQWRSFLDKEREQRTEDKVSSDKQRQDAMAYGMSSVQKMTDAILTLATALGEHDKDATIRYNNIMNALDGLRDLKSSKK